MKFNLVFKLYKDTIIISEIKKEVDYKSMNNTNVIDVKELKFSDDYIKDNFELVANFLNVVILKNNISNVQINNMDAAPIIIDLVNTWEHIKKVYFKQDKKVSLEVFLKLLDNDYLEEINCYEMSDYLIERIDLNKHVKVITRNEVKTESKFMKENFLSSYSDIYYKKVINVDGKLDKIELDELKAFIAINSRLKVIRIINYSNEILTLILDELQTYQKKNIQIQIEEKNNDLDTIFNTVTYLKRTYRKYIEKNNIDFKLNYSKEYKRNNFMKAMNLKLFSVIVLSIALLFSIVIGLNYYNQYLDRGKIEDQMEEILEIVENAEIEITEDIELEEPIVVDPNISTTTTTKKKGSGDSYASAYYTNYKQVFTDLLKKNKDTVAWLKVKNTKVNYPVVQGKTNDYYLNRDFNKRKNSMGWIFMDYRNDPVNLDQNTIIYGHNIKQGIMFGTIKNMMEKKWYTNKDNLIITFNTPTANMKFKIFSLYNIEPTEDYLQTEFNTKEEFREFINMITKRSKHNFKVEIPDGAKILTLSTCYRTNTRNVVHAVLIKEEKVETTKTTKKTTTTTKKVATTTTVTTTTKAQ